ncbi:hypothetical protein J6590_042455 [Homalodisca vitripennis]|nr:hypothetical protein J6590_042455 [Homalodisca vitripennis]
MSQNISQIMSLPNPNYTKICNRPFTNSSQKSVNENRSTLGLLILMSTATPVFKMVSINPSLTYNMFKPNDMFCPTVSMTDRSRIYYYLQDGSFLASVKLPVAHTISAAKTDVVDYIMANPVDVQKRHIMIPRCRDIGVKRKLDPVYCEG